MGFGSQKVLTKSFDRNLLTRVCFLDAIVAFFGVGRWGGPGFSWCRGGLLGPFGASWGLLVGSCSAFLGIFGVLGPFEHSGFLGASRT